jgi:hypothetical protein
LALTGKLRMSWTFPRPALGSGRRAGGVAQLPHRDPNRGACLPFRRQGVHPERVDSKPRLPADVPGRGGDERRRVEALGRPTPCTGTADRRAGYFPPASWPGCRALDRHAELGPRPADHGGAGAGSHRGHRAFRADAGRAWLDRGPGAPPHPALRHVGLWKASSAAATAMRPSRPARRRRRGPGGERDRRRFPAVAAGDVRDPDHHDR